MPSTSTCTPPPTSHSVFPCQAYTAVVLDASNGIDNAAFSRQQNFVANHLFDSRWTFDQVAIGAYDDSDPDNFQNPGQFDTMESLAEAQNLVNALAWYGDSTSMTT